MENDMALPFMEADDLNLFDGFESCEPSSSAVTTETTFTPVTESASHGFSSFTEPGEHDDDGEAYDDENNDDQNVYEDTWQDIFDADGKPLFDVFTSDKHASDLGTGPPDNVVSDTAGDVCDTSNFQDCTPVDLSSLFAPEDEKLYPIEGTDRFSHYPPVPDPFGLCPTEVNFPNFPAASAAFCGYAPYNTVVNEADLNDGLFKSLVGVKGYLMELCVTADLLRAAHITVNNHESRIQKELKEMWQQNTNLRQRGLRGGTARVQRRIKGNYVSFKEHAETISQEFLDHRIEVEKADLEGRGRLKGLESLGILFKETFKWLRGEQTVVDQALVDITRYNNGFAKPDMIDAILNYEVTVWGENKEKYAKYLDIKSMLDAFHDEYNESL